MPDLNNYSSFFRIWNCRRVKILYYLPIILCLFTLDLYSQNLIDLQEYVIEKDKFEVNKSINKIKEAGELTREANNYYNEALELQSNYELDEKTLQKNIAKAEDKALSIQMQADKIYFGAYKSLYEIAVKNMEGLGSVSYGNPDIYIRSAEEMMNNAAKKRSEAGGTNNPYEKAALLNDAAGMENTAIENMILAFKAHSGETFLSEQEKAPEEYYGYQEEDYSAVQVDTYSGNANEISENLAVDQEMINKYESYVSDESIPDPIMISGAGVTGVSEISVDEARNVLQGYTSGDTYATYGETAVPKPEMTYQDSIVTPNVQEYFPPTAEEIAAYESNTSAAEESSQSREAFDISTVVQSKGIRFMVQLAASKIPLTRAQMQAIYSGNLTVEVIREDSWYKYRITGFRLFSDANRVANKSGVRSAWVLATRDGNPIDLMEAREMTRVMETDVKRQGRTAIENEADFYVQVMASKVRISDDEMKSICGYSSACREIIEEGWFKYQVFGGTDNQKALSLRSEIPGKAFIVAYKAGLKQILYRAIQNK